jgi:C1A family cysteine protease
MALGTISVGDLQGAIARAGASWQAGVTPLSQLSDDQKVLHLGAVPPPGTASLDEREQLATAKAQGGAGIGAVGAPASFDWRNVGGTNYITPIEDQGGCGSCVAFGTIATIEGTARVYRGNPNLAIDLSEAQLFYCYARSQGYSCGTGWWPNNAFDFAKNNGLVDAACFPYTAGDQACNLCGDWQNRLTYISGWHTVGGVADMKAWISSRGPVSTCFTVYNDFFYYAGGVYRHVTGNVAGGHCVSVVGYDDANGCWICKNSWGTGFGEGGFFRIAYGNCGIDAEMWLAEGIADTGWIRGAHIAGLWTIDQDRNAWVYVAAVGWRKLSPDNDNILLDMLSQLAAAKAAKRTVDFYQEQGVIKQIYVY